MPVIAKALRPSLERILQELLVAVVEDLGAAGVQGLRVRMTPEGLAVESGAAAEKRARAKGAKPRQSRRNRLSGWSS